MNSPSSSSPRTRLLAGAVASLLLFVVVCCLLLLLLLLLLAGAVVVVAAAAAAAVVVVYRRRRRRRVFVHWRSAEAAPHPAQHTSTARWVKTPVWPGALRGTTAGQQHSKSKGQQRETHEEAAANSIVIHATLPASITPLPPHNEHDETKKTTTMTAATKTAAATMARAAPKTYSSTRCLCPASSWAAAEACQAAEGRL